MTTPDDPRLVAALDALRAICREQALPLVVLISHGHYPDGTHSIRVVGSQLGTPQCPPIFDTIVDTFVKIGELEQQRVRLTDG